MTIADFSVQLFNSSANIMLVLLPVIFLGKITYANMFGAYEDHIDNVKTLFVYLVFIKGFQYLLPYLVDLPHLINNYYNSKMNFDVNQILSSFAKSEEGSSLSFDILSILDAFTDLLEMLVQLIVDILFLVLSLLAPIIILLSVMLNLGVGVKLLFGIFFILATWNAAIAACDVFLKEIATRSMDMNMFVVALMSVLLKIIAGFTNILLVLKSPAAGGVAKGLSSLKSGLMGDFSKTQGSSFSGRSQSSFAYANNSSLDQKLSRSQPTEVGTFAGVSKAESYLKNREIWNADIKKAAQNLGLDKKTSEGNKNKKIASQQNEAAPTSNDGTSSLDLSASVNSKSSYDSSQITTSSVAANVSENHSMPLDREASSKTALDWSQDKSNLAKLSDNDLKESMDYFSSQKKNFGALAAEQSKAMNAANPNNDSIAPARGDAVNYERAFLNVRDEAKKRKNEVNRKTSPATPETSEDSMQTGHLDKKKGRR